MLLDVSAILQKTRSTQPSLTIDGAALMPRVPSQQRQQQHHHQQQQGQLQQHNVISNDPTSKPQTSTTLLQGAKRMKAYSVSYYERLIGKWIASNETDIPGPFAPLDLEPFLWFLQCKISATLSLPSYNNNAGHSTLCRFYDELVAKECIWIERYPRPRELESSIKAMTTTAGGERDLFWTALDLAYLRIEGGELVQATENGPYFAVRQRFGA